MLRSVIKSVLNRGYMWLTLQCLLDKVGTQMQTWRSDRLQLTIYSQKELGVQTLLLALKGAS